jgi:hypothetical protein
LSSNPVLPKRKEERTEINEIESKRRTQKINETELVL